MRCAECGEDCRIIDVDYGIGAGEYWGAPFYDVQISSVTNCCEAGWIDDDLDEPGEYITEHDMEEVKA